MNKKISSACFRIYLRDLLLWQSGMDECNVTRPCKNSENLFTDGREAVAYCDAG